MCMFVQLWDSMFYKSNVLIVPHFYLIVALCLYPFIRILYVKIRMNRIGAENQGVLWFWHGRFIKHFYVKSQNGGRFSGEDDNKCKKKCTFAARSVF